MGKVRYISKRLLSKNIKNYDLIVFKCSSFLMKKGDIKIINKKGTNIDYLYIRFNNKKEKDFNNMLEIIKVNEYKNILISKYIINIHKLEKILYEFVKNNDINIDILIFD